MSLGLFHIGLIELGCLLDTGWIRPSAWLTTSLQSRSPSTRHEHVDFDAAVRAATDRLPIGQAHALWLVDICQATYAQGAAETRTSPYRFARRVHAARRNIRRNLP